MFLKFFAIIVVTIFYVIIDNTIGYSIRSAWKKVQENNNQSNLKEMG
jgi:hypothetical protein